MQNSKLQNLNKLKVALVHDYLAGYGGAERVLEVLRQVFPRAPIYTSLFLPQRFGPHRERVKDWPIRTSFLQKRRRGELLFSSKENLLSRPISLIPVW